MLAVVLLLAWIYGLAWVANQGHSPRRAFANIFNCVTLAMILIAFGRIEAASLFTHHPLTIPFRLVNVLAIVIGYFATGVLPRRFWNAQPKPQGRSPGGYFRNSRRSAHCRGPATTFRRRGMVWPQRRHAELKVHQRNRKCGGLAPVMFFSLLLPASFQPVLPPSLLPIAFAACCPRSARCHPGRCRDRCGAGDHRCREQPHWFLRDRRCVVRSDMRRHGRRLPACRKDLDRPPARSQLGRLSRMGPRLSDRHTDHLPGLPSLGQGR